MTPGLTVFTASVRADLARLWLACVPRAFPPDTRVEIFDDSGRGALDAVPLRGATRLGPSPGRRDFQEAYNDALVRADTRWLALVDTDAYPVSRDVWPRVKARLEAGAAAVLCAPRDAVDGHDTVALVLDVAVYRAALADVPNGFLPRAETEGGRPGSWRGEDTGDLLTRAVEARGGRVETLRLEDARAFVRFDALTNVFLLASWAGDGALLALARSDAYLREGCLGNLALRPAYARLFPEGPPFELALPAGAVLRALAPAGPRALARAAARILRLRAGARRLMRFLSADGSP